MAIKKNDNVVVTTGRDKGKSGKVLKVLRTENRIIVEGINVMKVHKKKTGTKPGQIVEIPAPIHMSNVKLAK